MTDRIRTATASADATGLTVTLDSGRTLEYPNTDSRSRNSFNRFIAILEAANPGFKWQWREAALVGLTVTV